MFGIGWSEFLVIAIVAIIVIGPKDLPKVMRSFGRATAKMRSTAAEFREHFDNALKEVELDEVKSALDEVRNLDPRRSLTQVLDPFRDVAKNVSQSFNETSDALKGIELTSVDDRSFIDNSDILPPANSNDQQRVDEMLEISPIENFYRIDTSHGKKSKSLKRYASFEMKHPTRKHRLKHNGGGFSRNRFGKKAARYFERSIMSPAFGQTKNDMNEAQGFDE